jgi:hypothetical protein
MCMCAVSKSGPYRTDFITRRTYGGDSEQGEDIRSGFEPSEIPPADVPEFAVGDEEEDEDSEDSKARRSPSYGNLAERNVWDSPDDHR